MTILNILDCVFDPNMASGRWEVGALINECALRTSRTDRLRVTIDRPANLSDAGLHRSLRLVEREAGDFPFEPAMGEEDAGLAFLAISSTLLSAAAFTK
jgi:hypothetical protein